VRLLHASGAQVVEDDLHEIAHGAVVAVGIAHAVDQLVVLVHAQHTVRRQAFDRERAGHAHFLPVVIGFVVEIFELGLGRDGGVDLALAGDARVPPAGV
jgi:hypothetical protein